MTATPKASILIIGNEILSGRTQDANIAWIAQKLAPQGISLAEVRVVPDIEAAIIKAVNELRAAYDYVFTTGGIGPTHDDITAASVAKAFNVKLIEHPEALQVLRNHYGLSELTPARAKMAQVPESAALIANPVSGAPGFIIGNVYVMAGVPRIMQAMMDNVAGLLTPGKPILSNTVVCSLTESVIAEGLSALQEKFPQVSIGSYPQFRSGVGSLSLVLRGTDESALRGATEELADLIRSLGDQPHPLGLQVEVGNL